MDYSGYTNKVKELINDTNTYQPLDTDPSKTTVNRINKKLTTLRNQISKQIYMIKSGPTTQQSLRFTNFQKISQTKFACSIPAESTPSHRFTALHGVDIFRIISAKIKDPSSAHAEVLSYFYTRKHVQHIHNSSIFIPYYF